MASPAACAQYSSLLAAVRVPTALRRRLVSSFFSRVRIPPAARTPPRSLSVSLSVLRPHAHRGASDRESAGEDSGFGFSPCDPAVEEPYTGLSADEDADDGLALHVPFVEDPFERVATTGLAEDTHDEGDADDGLVLPVPFVEDPFERVATTGLGEGAHDESDVNDDLDLPVLFVEDPFECVATTGLGEGAHDESDADDDLDLPVLFVEDPFERVATTGLGEGVPDEADAALVLHVPTEEPHEAASIVLHVSADEDPHELMATGLVLHAPTVEEPHVLTATGLVLPAPTVEEPHEVAATTDDDNSIVFPSRLTKKEIDEFETLDFSRAAINERFRLESKEAKAAVTGAVAGVLRPLRELVDDVRSLESIFDLKEFQIGMPFGAIMTCMGMYQLWKLSPSTCIDVAMYYAFYKLSVIAADVQRRGFSPDWIIRINLGIIIAVLAKEQGNKGLVPLDFIRVAIFMIYFFSVGMDVIGFKKYASSFLPMLLNESDI